jgi:putative addiction module component (TIGR02574 family)
MGRPAVDIAKLTPAERLRLVEDLWDSLCDTPESVPLTDAQRTELDRRLDDLEREGPSGIPWDEVVRRIGKRYLSEN